MTGNSILSVRELSMFFGGLVALNRLTFRVGEKEVVGLIGPNGAGKTTAINCIAGFQKPAGGELVLLGKDITGFKPHEIAALGLSRTFQLTDLFAKVTVLDSLLTGLHLRLKPTFGDAIIPLFRENKKEREARAMAWEILNFVGMTSENDKLCQNISNFHRKRLGLAIALATNPRLLLIDELVSGLSAEEIDDTMRLINKIRESGISILLVEHNMRVITGLCDRITVLNFGVKIAEGTPIEIVADKEVQKAYLGDFDYA